MLPEVSKGDIEFRRENLRRPFVIAKLERPSMFGQSSVRLDEVEAIVLTRNTTRLPCNGCARSAHRLLGSLYQEARPRETV